jgi:hypothetical protein
MKYLFVKCHQCSGSGQEERIPLERGAMKGSAPYFSLVLKSPFKCARKKRFLIALVVGRRSCGSIQPLGQLKNGFSNSTVV